MSDKVTKKHAMQKIRKNKGEIIKLWITKKRYDKAQYDENDENCYRERKIRRYMKESGHINTCIDMYNVSREGRGLAAIAGYRHQSRCRQHRRSGICFISPEPEHSGYRNACKRRILHQHFFRKSTAFVRHRHSGI